MARFTGNFHGRKELEGDRLGAVAPARRAHSFAMVLTKMFGLEAADLRRRKGGKEMSEGEERST